MPTASVFAQKGKTALIGEDLELENVALQYTSGSGVTPTGYFVYACDNTPA
jgi:hypothetical protein